MNREEKETLILKVWNKMIKGQQNTPVLWQNQPSHFIKWSLKKVRNKRYILTIKNTDYPEILQPYNLIWREKESIKKENGNKRQ